MTAGERARYERITARVAHRDISQAGFTAPGS